MGRKEGKRGGRVIGRALNSVGGQGGGCGPTALCGRSQMSAPAGQRVAGGPEEPEEPEQLATGRGRPTLTENGLEHTRRGPAPTDGRARQGGRGRQWGRCR